MFRTSCRRLLPASCSWVCTPRTGPTSSSPSCRWLTPWSAAPSSPSTWRAAPWASTQVRESNMGDIVQSNYEYYKVTKMLDTTENKVMDGTKCLVHLPVLNICTSDNVRISEERHDGPEDAAAHDPARRAALPQQDLPRVRGDSQQDLALPPGVGIDIFVSL